MRVIRGNRGKLGKIEGNYGKLREIKQNLENKWKLRKFDEVEGN